MGQALETKSWPICELFRSSHLISCHERVGGTPPTGRVSSFIALLCSEHVPAGLSDCQGEGRTLGPVASDPHPPSHLPQNPSAHRESSPHSPCQGPQRERLNHWYHTLL